MIALAYTVVAIVLIFSIMTVFSLMMSAKKADEVIEKFMKEKQDE